MGEMTIRQHSQQGLMLWIHGLNSRLPSAENRGPQVPFQEDVSLDIHRVELLDTYEKYKASTKA